MPMRQIMAYWSGAVAVGDHAPKRSTRRRRFRRSRRGCVRNCRPGQGLSTSQGLYGCLINKREGGIYDRLSCYR